jgi:hypothetical protein
MWSVRLGSWIERGCGVEDVPLLTGVDLKDK